MRVECGTGADVTLTVVNAVTSTTSDDAERLKAPALVFARARCNSAVL
jgi:hypothetical protein